MLLLSLIVFSLELLTCRLVLDSWDELYQENGQADELDVARQTLEIFDYVLLGAFLPRLQPPHLPGLGSVLVSLQMELEIGSAFEHGQARQTPMGKGGYFFALSLRIFGDYPSIQNPLDTLTFHLSICLLEMLKFVFFIELASSNEVLFRSKMFLKISSIPYPSLARVTMVRESDIVYVKLNIAKVKYSLVRPRCF